MLESKGIQQRDDDSEGTSYINTVGDDEGQKEYPFVTSPKVLSVMRNLYDLHKKQLVQDFINCAYDYENCAKGSYLSKECKFSVAGPYASCPVLHGDGDEFFSLPLPRKSPTTSKPLQIFMRKPKKRANCRKCSQVTFNHFDGAMYHENYLKEVTYAKLKVGDVPLIHYYNTGNSDEMASSGEQKYSDIEEDAERSWHGEDYPQEGWSDLKELIDPWRPLKTAEDKDKRSSKVKKRGKSTTKPVTSRYKEVAKRRSRPNINSMHVSNRLMSEVARTCTETETSENNEDKTVAKNPFPMPDVFEEIYFGKMPESINSLPVSLQNFKKIQLKMAGESASSKTFESHKRNVTTPSVSKKSSNNVSPRIQVRSESLTMGIKGNSIGSILNQFHSNSNLNSANRSLKLIKHLPQTSSTTSSATGKNSVININSPNNINDNVKLEGVNRLSESIFRTTEKTAETEIGNQNNNENNNGGKQQRTLISFRKTVSNHAARNMSAGKKKNSIVLPPTRKITSRRLSTPINSMKKSSSHSVTRKNKSYYALLRDQREQGVGTKGKKRKKTTRRLTTAQIREEESTAVEYIKKSEANGQRLHNEVGNSFHDEDGTFNPNKYRESLFNFIEKKETYSTKFSVSEDNSIAYDNETSNTTYKSTVNEATRAKANEFKENNVALNTAIRASQSTVRNKDNNSKNAVRNGNARPRTRSEINNKSNTRPGKHSNIRDSKRIWIEAATPEKILSDKTSNFSYPSSTSPNF